MPILVSEVLLRENKKSSNKMLPLVGIEPLAQVSKFNMLLPTLTWHVLLRRSLNFCSCTTLFLDDSVRINRAWLYKDPKVSVLQANVKLDDWPHGKRSFERDWPTTLKWCMTDNMLCFALTVLCFWGWVGRGVKHSILNMFWYALLSLRLRVKHTKDVLVCFTLTTFEGKAY